MYPYALTKILVSRWLFTGQIYMISPLYSPFFQYFWAKISNQWYVWRVFGVFLAQLLAKKPLTIVGDGSQKRDFTYVTDAVSALIAASESSISGECMNVGSDRPVSINELVRLLGASETVNIPKRPGEPECTFADTAKIKRLLNWSSEVTFEIGVQRLLENLDYWKDAPVWTPESIGKATKDWFNI